MKARLKDIAQELDLSVVTVSKALRNYQDISPETRRRVIEKAREMNYRPNWAARSLVTQRSYTIGMVLPHLRHTFFQEAYQAIFRETSPRGYTVLIAISLEDAETEEREIEQMIARQVDGLIIASTRSSSEGGFFRRLDKLRLPYVLLDRRFENLQANFVGVDDEELGFVATEHLIRQGRKRVAYVRGPEVSTSLLRMKGYRRALKAHGLNADGRLIRGGKGDEETGRLAMEKLLEMKQPPDGVFCYNDPVAAGAMKAAFDAGLGVPDDVAIVGAGNMQYSDLFRVPLTTVDQGSVEIGLKAARLLLNLISGGRRRVASVTVQPRLIVRESSRKQTANR